MSKEKLSSLSLGPVELNVKNLQKMKDFYTKILGLNILEEKNKTVTLGKKNTPLLILHNAVELNYPLPGEAGLYHFAILFSSRGDLARTVYQILKNSPEHFSGSGDHLVSEAFYFTDPEGNGIELYYDRDRSQWQWENKQIKMATLYIDPQEYLEKHIALEEKDTEIKMGHIHLKVGNIEKAREFYVNILGFDVTAELPNALFVSVDGYHHHIGMNTWESLGATERSDVLGLKTFSLTFNNKNEYEKIKEKLLENNISFEEKNNLLTLHDPWKNKIRIALMQLLPSF